MCKPTKLIEDATGRSKLKVSLPGGRYQLSLNDSAVTLLKDDLSLEVGATVPDPIVPILVATRGAWFPHEKNTDRIIEGLPTKGVLTDAEHDALVAYVTSVLIRSVDKERVVDVVVSSPIADSVDCSQLRVKDLPKPPSGIDFEHHSPIHSDSDSQQS